MAGGEEKWLPVGTGQEAHAIAEQVTVVTSRDVKVEDDLKEDRLNLPRSLVFFSVLIVPLQEGSGY